MFIQIDERKTVILLAFVLTAVLSFYSLLAFVGVYELAGAQKTNQTTMTSNPTATSSIYSNIIPVKAGGGINQSIEEKTKPKRNLNASFQ